MEYSFVPIKRIFIIMEMIFSFIAYLIGNTSHCLLSCTYCPVSGRLSLNLEQKN